MSRILADRQQFIDCCKGDLLIRDDRGVVTHLGDGATEALEAVERGETVGLTVSGKVVSLFSWDRGEVWVAETSGPVGSQDSYAATDSL